MDQRLPVRCAAVMELSHAILDKHSLSVPAAVMSTILKDILAPVSIVLGRVLESTARGGQEGASKRDKLNSESNNVVATEEQIEEEIRLLKMLAACEGGAKDDTFVSETQDEEQHTLSKDTNVDGGPTHAEEESKGVSAESLLLLSQALSNDGSTVGTHPKGGPAAECLSTLCKV